MHFVQKIIMFMLSVPGRGGSNCKYPQSSDARNTRLSYKIAGGTAIRNSKLCGKTANSQETHEAISSNLLLLLLMLLLVPLLLLLGRRTEVGGAGKVRRAYKI